jgi:hypothetical protein
MNNKWLRWEKLRGEKFKCPEKCAWMHKKQGTPWNQWSHLNYENFLLFSNFVSNSSFSLLPVRVVSMIVQTDFYVLR